MSEHHLTNKPFSDFDLPAPLLEGLADAGFQYCTPIQAETLPLALAGQDVAGQAQTGTGKTVAFLLAIYHYLLTRPAPAERKAAPARTPQGGTEVHAPAAFIPPCGVLARPCASPSSPRALILAPTRELAIQIYRDAEVLGSHCGLREVLVYGGTGYDSQRQQLESGVDILIGTPGRIIDYFKQKIFSLKSVQVMVLDEADRMFDLGFIKDIRYLLRRMPPPTERLGMLFSATLSYRVNELAYEHMNNPQSVKIETGKITADKVTENLYHTANEEKIPLLIDLLTRKDNTRTLIFSNTKHTAEKIGAWLEGNGLHAGVLSGDVPQKKRQHLMDQFKQGELPILVATDVAARGLHIPDVSHVINFDLPQDAEDYVHRIGRTARAGASGDAISFACENFAYSLPEIETFIGHKIPVAAFDHAGLPELQPPAKRAPRRRTAGRRPGPAPKKPAGPKRQSKTEGPHKRKPASAKHRRTAGKPKGPRRGNGPTIG